MNMNAPDPELISAYADGEVSETERAVIEQWLASHPRGRELVARVHVLGSAVRSLPREELPVEFGEQVRQLIANLPTPGNFTAPVTEVRVPSGSRVGSSRRWLTALVAGVALAVPLMVWRLSPQSKSPDYTRMTDVTMTPASLPKPVTMRSKIGPEDLSGMVPPAPGVADARGVADGPGLNGESLRAELTRGASDQLHVMTIELPGAGADPAVARAWSQTLWTQLTAQGFRSVRTLEFPADRPAVAADSANRPAPRKVSPEEVESFFVMLEGDVEALVAALEKTIEQTQQEEQIVSLAAHQLQSLDEELQRAANSVLEEFPAGSGASIATSRQAGVPGEPGREVGPERGRMIRGNAPRLESRVPEAVPGGESPETTSDRVARTGVSGAPLASRRNRMANRTPGPNRADQVVTPGAKANLEPPEQKQSEEATDVGRAATRRVLIQVWIPNSQAKSDSDAGPSAPPTQTVPTP